MSKSAKEVAQAEALEIQKAYLEELFMGAPEGIAVLDNKDFIIRINREFTEHLRAITGCQRISLILFDEAQEWYTSAFLDPPHEGVAETLRTLRADGIEVKIITGDNELVTQRVCAQVGFATDSIVLAGPNNSGKSTLLQALAVWNLALQRWRTEKGNGPQSLDQGPLSLEGHDRLLAFR